MYNITLCLANTSKYKAQQAVTKQHNVMLHVRVHVAYKSHDYS